MPYFYRRPALPSTTKFAEFLADRGVVDVGPENRLFFEGRIFFQRPGSRVRARPPAPARPHARARPRVPVPGKPDNWIFWSAVQLVGRETGQSHPVIRTGKLCADVDSLRLFTKIGNCAE